MTKHACNCHGCKTRAKREFWLIIAGNYSVHELARLNEYGDCLTLGNHSKKV